MSAFGTNHVGRNGGTAFGAVCPLNGRFVIVRTAGAGTGVAVLSFRYCHKNNGLSGILANGFNLTA
jgi:hypothetical protein